MTTSLEELKARVRTIPDWPKPGIQFRDITPLLHDAAAFQFIISQFCERYRDKRVDFIAGIEARGFILGGAIAHALNVGFIPIRKKGKLPHKTYSEDYALEYGSATLEVHIDACTKGARIVVIDDLIATGGTFIASTSLIRKLGGEIIEAAAIIELVDLNGRLPLEALGVSLHCLCEFGGH